MSRDQVARIIFYTAGGLSIFGFVFLALTPRPAALDFRSQMAMSRFADWMAVLAGVAILAGFFRQDRQTRTLSVIGAAVLCFVWAVVAAGNLPVA